MPLRIVGIGGEPATGKSTLVNSIFEGIEKTPMQRIRLLRYHEVPWEQRTVYVMGDYSGQIEFEGHFFGGTDKLSMAVLPEFLSVLRVWAMEKRMEDAILLFEGDRLFTRKTFEAINQMKEENPDCMKTLFLVLTASESEKKERHVKRNDSQEESWLKGRATKVERLCKAFPDIEQWVNETDLHSKVNKAWIKRWMRGEED